ncbi:MAG TPA: DEAD/DEAH box family ATP-dependent RNA helicase [Chlorobaculum sp.]|uniref:DEAD-box ATP-dependent RNA helicase RhpA n=1 Tax=Chlorobaculum tepidum (strain ATCC 49652 / DSM 12025 / NBRC 103806 / TLS) TaxID=194439 RepID=Q8KDL3_CHLTE|nr:DEAD/DEAH box helicase [Chlorobaculum tepidum]AAM72267.1 ATP-dependent RNA helicase DeaD [Chlorobaculum tepidum TLS]HBU22779.1 DEAD/DEAH box family ATP-dependent RNA helicase [Chlorobaculum sp.]
MPFSALGIIDHLRKALAEEGYNSPTPIQKEAIPVILEGNDLLACAQTGTGKTAAFALPVLQRLHQSRMHGEKRKIRCLVLTPTRELAIQIGESFTAYGRHTGLINTVIFGGVNQNPQTARLVRGVDILVATPGRLLDLIGQGHLHLRDIEYFVLDEADRMLDMGFIHDIRRVLAVLPKKRQSLFFSATMPPEIIKLSAAILHNPKEVMVTPVSSTVEIINQQILFVDRENKNSLLAHLLKERNIESALVFTRTKHGADKVARFLAHHDITAEAIHGNKSQNARQRALGNFKTRQTRVLVATDIAARGIDIDELEYVINIDLPNIPETYVHRIGRTGRAGNRGAAYSFCNAEEKAYLRDIEKLIARKIPVIEDHPFPMVNTIPENAAASKQPARKVPHQKKPSGTHPGNSHWKRK